MAIQNYDTAAARIGALAGEIIGNAIPTEVLGNALSQKDMPKNKSETIKFRSWVPYGGTVAAPNTWSVSAAAHITQEGVTPTADTITPRDVTATLSQYACLYALTDKDYDLYEDDIADAMKVQTGERMGLVREIAICGVLKAGTNKFYSGGTSRATVDGKITEMFMQRMIRSLNANHGGKITKVLSSSCDFGTKAVEAAYIAYCHTDCEQDIRALPGFRPTVDYGQRQVISEYELGTWGPVRFIVSADLSSIPSAATSVGAAALGLYTSGSDYPDVYPVILVAKDCAAQVKLRGVNAIEPTLLLPNKIDKNDPLGQRGYIGAKFWHTSVILNNGWMAVGEVAISALTE